MQCVFSVGVVWCHASGMQFVTLQECNLSRFRNAIKGVCPQTSIPLRNTKSCVHLRKLIILSAVAMVAVSLCCDDKMVMGARKES